MAKVMVKDMRPSLISPPWYGQHQQALLMVVFTFLLFGNTLFNGYNLDDGLVTRNHRLTAKGISAIPEIFTSPYYQDDMGYAYEYRPVVLATFAIEHQFFGESPLIGHFINLCLYALLCVVLLKLLLQFGRLFTPYIALFVTLLFCAYSPHTEVVCSLKNRDEILGLLFSLLSMLVAVNSVKSKKWNKAVLVPLFFLLAITSKSTYITFAFFIPLALIFFSEASLVVISACALSLSMLAFAFIDIQDVQSKILFIVGLNLAMIIVYLMQRRVNLVEWLMGVFAFTTTWVPIECYKGIKQWVTLPILKSSILPLLCFLMALFIKLFLIKGVLFSALFIIALLVLVLLANKNRKNFWNIEASMLVSLLFILMDYNSMHWSYSYLHVFGVLLIVYSMWVSRMGQPANRLLGFAVVIVVFLQDILLWTDVLDAFLFFLIFSFTFLPKGRLALLIIAVPVTLSVTSAFYDIMYRHGNDYMPMFELLFLSLALYKNAQYLVLFQKYANYFTGFILLLLSFLVFVLPPINVFTAFHSSTQFHNDPLNVVTLVKNTKTNRELSYIEYPLPPGSPANFRQGTASVVLLHYFKKTIVPYPLSFYYGYQFITPTNITEAPAVFGMLLFTVLVGLAVYFIRKNTIISFALIIYLVSLLLASGYFISVPGIVADRYLLTPSLGWCIVLGLGVIYMIQHFVSHKLIENIRDWSHFQKLLLLSPLLIYSLFTFIRNLDWKDPLTLMRKDINYVSNSAQAHNLLALNIMKHSAETPLSQQEQLAASQEAIIHFKRSLEIYPGTFNVAFDLGRVYTIRNRPDSAIYFYKKAASIDSSYNQLFLNVAELLYAQRQLKESLPYYQKYMELTPNIYDGYGKVSFVYFQLKDFQQSIAINKLAVQNLPNVSDPYMNIGQVYLAMQEQQNALFWLQKADSIARGANPNIKQMLQSAQKVN